jgi:hypothetical protein
LRRLVAADFLSLNGVAENTYRFCTDWEDVVDARGATLIATQDVDVLDRRSYDEWAVFWPGSDIKLFAILKRGCKARRHLHVA